MRVTVILCVGLGGIMGWEEGVGGRSYKAVAIRAGVPLAEHGFHHCGLTLGGRLGHILKEGGGWVVRKVRRCTTHSLESKNPVQSSQSTPLSRLQGTRRAFKREQILEPREQALESPY